MLEDVAFSLVTGVLIVIIAWVFSWRAAATRTARAWVRVRAR